MKHFSFKFSIVTVLLSVSCERLGSDTYICRPRYDTDYNGPSLLSTASQEEEGDESTLYVAGVEFPESYDWLRDSAAGASQSKLVLYRDSSRILEIPTGEDQLISTDPDTHHLIGGKIYTEYTTATHTVIKCNGEELFRYKGLEFLKGILVSSTDVWTLGQNKSGEGFSLRRSGEAVLLREKGSVIGDERYNPLGALYRDGESICFAYKVDEVAYIVEDGNPTKLEPDMSLICDIHRSDGVIYVLGTDKQSGLPVIRSSKGTVNINGIASIQEGVFVDCGTYLPVSGLGVSRASGNQCNFTKMGDKVSTYDPSDIFYAFLTPFGLSMVTVNGINVDIIMHDAQSYGRGQNCLFNTCHCILYKGRDFIVALSPRSMDLYPFVETSEGESEYRFHGYISGIELLSFAPT